jgi:hypothetical protein
MKNLFLGLAFLFMISNAHPAVLCKDPAVSDGGTYTCPFVTNIDTSGTSYLPTTSCSSGQTCYTPSGDGVISWNATGPWGSNGASIIVTGDSRCSTTNGSSNTAGYPVAGDGTGQYCWCRVRRDTGSLWAWVFRSDRGSASGCAAACAHSCANGALYVSDFRAALCSMPGN